MPKIDKDYIGIAVAIIRRGNDVLIAKRPKGKAFPDKWEFPGGKIEPMELPEKTIIREIKEELAIDIVVCEKLGVLDFKYEGRDDKRFQYHCYLCEISSGEPQLLLHKDLQWVDAEKLATFDLLEGDKKLLPLIYEKITQR